MRITEIVLSKVEFIDREVTGLSNRISDQFTVNMTTLLNLKASLDNLKSLIQQWDVEDSSPLELQGGVLECVTGIGRQ